MFIFCWTLKQNFTQLGTSYKNIITKEHNRFIFKLLHKWIEKFRQLPDWLTFASH